MIVKQDEQGNFTNQGTMYVCYVDLTSKTQQCPEM